MQPNNARTTASYASALAFELRRGPPPEDRDFIRIKFKNGTRGDFETYHAFGHKSDIAATEFIYRIEVGTCARF
jgi:lysosomal acid phosphatase